MYVIRDHDDGARSGGHGRRAPTNAMVSILVLLALAASACGDGAPEPTPAAEPLTADEKETAAYLSERTMELWVVYNR